MGPVVALFSFTIRQTLVNRKIWLTVLILAAPCALALLIRNFAPSMDRARELREMYHITAQLLLMSVLVPLVCMVHGAALIGADVDAQTITYLITRRLRRVTVLLVKFVATGLVVAALCDLAMLVLHVCGLAGRDVASLVAHSGVAGWVPASDLNHYLVIIPVAVFVYLAVFTLIGLLTARPLAVSVFYLITVELILSNLPLRARVYSVLHHLRVTLVGMMPQAADLYELPRELRQELYPASATALPELIGIVLIALALAAVLITVRELVPTKVSRE